MRLQETELLPWDLIDGEELCELVEKHQLGVPH